MFQNFAMSSNKFLRKFFEGFSVYSVKRSVNTKCKILGIETSCDDTGCAIVDEKGDILGESLKSQQSIHTKFGGILPPLARDLHKENIENVVDATFIDADMPLGDVDAIAVTVKPGLSLSLLVGMNYAKNLALTSKKPLIPIHHMEAHALTVRMIGKVPFPFLVLLISGGHCLISVVQDVDKFITLGKSLDDAPGEALDKISRRLKLSNMEDLSEISGGKAIEILAAQGDPTRFPIAEPLLKNHDCNFSFAGIKNSARKHIIEEELSHDIVGDMIIPNVEDTCASVQLAVTKHLCRRVQRAISYVSMTGLIPDNNQVLVASGGVASNAFIKQALTYVCDQLGWRVVVPPPNLCTDNGVMIAWNGVERYLINKGLVPYDQLDTVDITPKCPLGEDISNEVASSFIKCKWISLKPLLAA